MGVIVVRIVGVGIVVGRIVGAGVIAGRIVGVSIVVGRQARCSELLVLSSIAVCRLLKLHS